jgi:hypothetical protein
MKKAILFPDLGAVGENLVEEVIKRLMIKISLCLNAY